MNMLEKKIYKLLHISQQRMLFKIFIGLVCLTLLPFDLLTFITGTPSAKAADELIEYKLQQDDQVIDFESTYDIRSKLWLTDVASLKEERNDENELELLIEKIRAVDLASQEIASEESEISEQIILSEPNDKETEAIELNKKDVQEIKTDIQYENITNDTLKRIMDLTKEPEKVNNPFELAEVLFLSDNLQVAAIFYKEALRRQDPNDITSTQDRAWLLFQIGNCLRDYDMVAAKDFYGKLVTEYSDLQWADVAKIQSDLIDWYTQDNPDEFIQEK